VNPRDDANRGAEHSKPRLLDGLWVSIGLPVWDPRAITCRRVGSRHRGRLGWGRACRSGGLGRTCDRAALRRFGCRSPNAIREAGWGVVRGDRLDYL